MNRLVPTLNSTKLSDCPFCGKPPVLENTVTEAGISCAPCRVLMKQRHARYCDDPAIEAIIERWNRRVLKAEDW